MTLPELVVARAVAVGASSAEVGALWDAAEALQVAGGALEAAVAAWWTSASDAEVRADLTRWRKRLVGGGA